MLLLVILCLFAFILLEALATFNVGARWNLIAAGLVFLGLALIIPPIAGAVH